MTIRQPKNSTSHFGLPHPFLPQTGERASLMVEGDYPYCAMMQVVEADTHCNYVVCRGWDPSNREFFAYEEGDPEQPGVPVAKPYWNRQKGVYRIGQMFPAFLPLPAGMKDGDVTVPRIGQNPGKAEPEGDECKGHPDGLDEEIVHLTDDGGIYINWMLLDGGGKQRVRYCTAENHPGLGVVFTAYAPGVWNPDSHDWDFTCDADHTHKIIDRDYGVPAPDAGAQGYADWEASTAHGKILVVVTMDCDTRGLCCS